MKKIILTILLTSFTLLSNGHLKDTSKLRIEPKTLPKLKTTNQNLVLKDSLVINPKISQSQPTIIYLKNSESVDYFKYIFPIFTLLIGIMLNRYLDFKNDRKKVKKSGRRWFSELIILEKPIESQIKNIESFLIEHDKPEFTFPRPVLVTTLDCEIFSTLDKSDLIEYLQKFKKNSYENAVKKTTEINSYISILKSHYDNFKKHFEEYKVNVSSYTTSISRNLQALQKEFVKYGVSLEAELGKDPVNDPRYRPILDLFNAEILPYMQNGKYDIYKLEKDFFAPMIHVLSKLRLDPRTNQMKDYVQNSLTEIKGIKLEKTYIRENFNTIKDWYKESKTDLPQMIALLQ